MRAKGMVDIPGVTVEWDPCIEEKEWERKLTAHGKGLRHVAAEEVYYDAAKALQASTVADKLHI